MATTAATSGKPASKTYPFWFGGECASLAACCTHPLDLVKVRLQTMKGHTRMGTAQAIVTILRVEGPLALFNGLSASLLRQATYSTVRFGVYDVVKEHIPREANGTIPVYKMMGAAVVAGCVGGVFGNPADVINVRMQNDGQLPPEKQRNYRHALDGLRRVTMEEGAGALMRGVGPNIQRAAIMTCSQLTSYDFFKAKLLAMPYFGESVWTHFAASLLSGLVATTVCSPVDVVKTRVMNAPPGSEFKGTLRTMGHMLRHEGISSLFKGWVAAFTRLGPHTIITFIILEQIRSLYDRRRESTPLAMVAATSANTTS
ncbi:mitochondrial carrier domain-containing protein [Syncephalis pseudoplumigaleata]|uniref:Mitochondrial carrier domain-containing protein n=1 Tax=Syncephalis pseudoplumigaleata TaxID=1712513 RepID=A0A4V1J1T0_9FUNG|nr:mitochondrial carrier domain-containing protein [Syncephalis pseudoplumigaleata]|eukprot:RKP26129.1 mitochondrial carrier domain-containing protein [Syncephalis pseudoplumigaleata]